MLLPPPLLLFALLLQLLLTPLAPAGQWPHVLLPRLHHRSSFRRRLYRLPRLANNNAKKRSCKNLFASSTQKRAENENTVRLWLLSSDNSSATCVATLEGHSDSVRSIAFHPTASLLATGSNDRTVRLWLLSSDNSSATCVATLAGNNSPVAFVAFHPTAPLLATDSSDETVRLWR